MVFVIGLEVMASPIWGMAGDNEVVVSRFYVARMVRC
jgi:hypothetical protein